MKIKRGKKYRNVSKDLDPAKLYSMSEAVALLPKTVTTKFDSSVEVHVRLNIDPKHADQQIRSTITLPNGTGKSKIVAAFVPDDRVKEAEAAGADFAGSQDLIEKVLQKNWTDFDIAVATPDMMRHMGKLGKVLGTKGLMPNPKSGTVTNDLEKTIKEVKGGRVEFRNDPAGIIHGMVGKISFGEEKLRANIKAYLDAVLGSKPAGVKGTFVGSITVTTTMGPGIKLDPAKLTD